MRISDWSSDVCSSDLFAASFFGQGREHIDRAIFAHVPRWATSRRAFAFLAPELRAQASQWDALAFAESRLPANILDWAPLGRDQYVEAKTLLRSEEHPSEIQSLMRNPYADFGLK